MEFSTYSSKDETLSTLLLDKIKLIKMITTLSKIIITIITHCILTTVTNKQKIN